MQTRHICAYCNAKRYEKKMVLLRFPIIHREAWVCFHHISTAKNLTSLIYVKQGVSNLTDLTDCHLK